MATPGDAGTPRSTPSAMGSGRRCGDSARELVGAALAVAALVGAVLACSPRSRSLASRSESAATAAGASLPRPTMVTVSPAPISSAMIETTLRAFASRAPAHQSQVGLELARGRRERRRRTRVQSGLGRDDDGSRSHGLALRGDGRRRRSTGERENHQHIAPRHHASRAPVERRDTIGIRDHHLRQQAAGTTRNQIRIEVEERVARVYHVALADEGGESLSLERDGVEADVNDDLQPVRLQRHRVPGAMDLEHPGIARREQPIAQRIDRDAIAHEALRERGIRHLFEGHDDPGQRGDDGQRRRRRRLRLGLFASLHDLPGKKTSQLRR